MWQNLTEEDRRKVYALIDRFTGNFKLLLKEFVALGCGSVDEIEKLRVCYCVTKEDPSIFFNPVP